MLNIKANQVETFTPKSNIVPCNFACAYIASIGMITAEIVKPKVTHIQLVPALYPRKGGRMRFPAPKKSEKRAKAVIKVCLMCFIPGYL